VDLVATHRIALTNEGVEHIFREIFAFDHHFLLLWVFLRIERGQSVDTIGLLGDTRCDRSRAEAEEAGSPDDGDLRAPRN
jgi:hypothetical protein